MTYWIDYGWYMEACDTLVKARATAVKMIEGGIYNMGKVAIYPSKTSKKAIGQVGVLNGHYVWTEYNKKYGTVQHAMFKNGRLAR